MLLNKHSKAEIANLCQVAERTVGYMRSLKKLFENKSGDAGAKLFRERLQKYAGANSLDDVKWATARQVYAGVEAKEINEEDRAQRLARNINNRLTDKLKKDPSVTARALEIYDPELPRALMEAWKSTAKNPRLEDTEEAEAALATLPDAEGPGEPLPDL